MRSLKLSPLFRIILGLVLSIISGLALVLAFPPYGIWPLALIGLVPMLVAQFRIMPARFSSLASAVGVAVWLQGYLGPVFAPVGTFMVWLPLMVGVLNLLTDAGSRNFHAKTNYRWFVLGGIANWSGGEMIRLFLPIAGTWAFIAYPFYRQLWLIQPVSIFGIIGMGLVVILVNYTLALLLMGWLDRRWQLDPTAPIVSAGLMRRWAIIGGAVFAAWIGLSLVLFNIPLNTPSVKAAAIQPSVSPIISANQGLDVADLHARMVDQTRIAGEMGSQFIVWPEGSFLWDPQVDNRIDFASLAGQTQAHLALGYVVVEENGLRNEATIINPDGQFLGVFGKDHPVTFGGETSLTRGTYPVYDTPIGKLGTIICYDLDYTDTARKLVAQGAQLIGVPSNDWSTIADKHYAHVVFRAVENRVAMVKADGSYDSAIIDPYGRIVALAAHPEGREATLVADVQLGSGKGTLSTLLGDWVGWLSLALMAFFIFGSKALEKRALAGQK
ncbi:MAG TPA: nitrilase-related carbon-nitrogen hydrolase [Anaerolineaceae bacterium]|jgi:apolipoprotein N-acyltransferase|nr:nitrilase-related carbon-nitrogen hydrolase [Anaerolineaceae bacterium]